MTEPVGRSRDAVNKIFGNALPEISIDEREPVTPDDEIDRDRWLRDNVPPHHD